MPVDLRVRSKRFPYRRPASRLIAATLAISIALAPSQPSALAAELPMPTGNWLGSGQATHAYSGNTLTINQTSNRAILNWQSFNISRDGEVRFNQPGASAAALNRIFDANPSVIQGRLTANGQIYLINQSGIIFGQGAQVNVGSLVASSLNISDSLFGQPLTSLTGVVPVFQWDESTGISPGSSLIRIETGADIRTANGGRVLVFAPRVENAGTISTPGGQAILAAGKKVYLAASQDTALRGLLVEVDPFLGQAPDPDNISSTDLVLNQALGRILAERGNITIAALAVNQSGRMSATTSVNLNGSIRLLARGAVQSFTDPATNAIIPLGTRPGNLTLGENSVTEVLPDAADDKTIQDEQKFTPSSVELAGRRIHFERDALVFAPGGNVTVTAQSGQIFQDPATPAVDGVRVYFEPGSRIDVSGIQDVAVPIERNVIEVELRGTELADSPLQRNSFLRGQKISVDVRKGTPLADISGVVGQVGRTVAEKATVGGTVTIKSEGDIVLREGAGIDVSGGSIRYQDGYINTTRLYSQGKLYDISEADPNRMYEGTADTFVKRYDKWGVTETFHALTRGEFERGYVEGKDAGMISLLSHSLVLEGHLEGRTQAGPNQRTAAPRAGGLIIGDSAQLNGSRAFKTPAVLLQASSNPLPAEFSFASGALPDDWRNRVTVPLDELRAGGIGRVAIYSLGAITLAPGADLSLPVDGSLTLVGRSIDIAGNISVPSGDITLRSVVTSFSTGLPADSHRLTVRDGASISARGLWVNDSPLLNPAPALMPAAVDGGSVTIDSIADALLGAGSLVDASAGGWLSSGGELAFGRAGSISVGSGNFIFGDSVAQQSALVLGGELRGYSGGEGGSLSIRASRVSIGGGPTATPGEVYLSPEFFSRGGFGQYAINGVSGLQVNGGTAVNAAAQNLVLDADFATRRTGSDIFSFSHIETLPVEARRASQITLSATGSGFGNLFVDEGASVSVDPGGSIALDAGNQLTVLGQLSAPGGKLSLSTPVPGQNDSFNSSQSIWLGSTARLLASGIFLPEPDDAGLRRGKVFDGGQVSINAREGYLVAETGSLIDVSGSSAVLDIASGSASSAQVRPMTVASNAGSISLSAREGILFDGDLHAHPGRGGQTAGGSLTVAMEVLDSNPFFPNGDRVVVLGENDITVPSGLRPGDAIDFAAYNGRGYVNAASIRNGEFDSLSLSARDRIELSGAVDLALRRSIQLDAPVIAGTGNANVRLDAAYVALGNSNVSLQAQQASSGGGGVLELSGNLVELIGRTALRGFGRTTISSDGDLRLRGVLNGVPSQTRPQDGRELIGALATGGDIRVRAAQVYPTTLSQFTLAVRDNPLGSIVFERSGTATPVLSAAGILTVEAPVIEQGGVLKAPLGQIVLDASQRLTLAAGSETSVSAKGQIIPFGSTELSGRDYVYVLDSASKLIFSTPPEKRIELSAPDIGVASGATVDLSGGGDLYAYEFTAGPGGSHDVLDPANAPGVYAILPSLGAGVAPYDHQYYGGVEGLSVGDAVYLSGAAGLPAGYYTLLPARYVLLPGAYLVSAKAGYQDMLPGQTQPRIDGSQVISGYRAYVARDGSVVRDSRFSGFEVRPGTVARTQSEYRDTLASSFFVSGSNALLPGDAGRLAVSASNALALDGNFLTGHASGRRGAEVDIDALRLAVLGEGAADPGAGYVRLDVADIARLNAESLLLGGIRTSSADGVSVQVGAQEVLIDNDAANPLRSPDLVIVAQNQVTVKAGSVIEGSGALSGSPRNVHIGASAQPGSGDGALLRVSSAEQAALLREGVSRAHGTLTVEEGATVRADKSIVLDATFDNRFLGSLTLGADGALALGASRISVGDVPAGTEGLTFSNSDIAALSSLSDLLLRSYSTVDLYGGTTLGSDALQNLAIEAAGIGGYANDGQTAQIRAQTVRLGNPNALSFTPAPGAIPGTGTLLVTANDVRFDEGGTSGFSANGFDSVNVEASREIIVSGTGGFSTPGELTLVSSRLTAETGAKYAIAAGGELRTIYTAADTDLPAPSGLAATLSLSGQRIVHGGRIVLPAGAVTLKATGADIADGVILATGSEIVAAGTEKRFSDTIVAASAGSLTMVSASGSVVSESGSTIDLTGVAGGDAGTLRIFAANGAALLDGTISASAAAVSGDSPRQGSFILDAGSIDNFSALNAKLNQAGFTESRDIRARNGDIVIAGRNPFTQRPGDRVTARNILLAVDDGDILVGGIIDASGLKGGSIVLAANRRTADTAGAGNVILLDGAVLNASSTADPDSVADSVGLPFGTRGQGGTVLLSSSGTGIAGDVGVDVRSGSIINVSSAGVAAHGSVVLRAPRINGDTDVLINPVNGAIVANAAGTASATVVAEAVKVYEDVSVIASSGGPGRLTFDEIAGDNDAFMESENVERMNLRIGGGVRVRAGVEIRSGGSLVLEEDWDLFPSRPGAEAGALTLRAAGNLLLNGSLSDGFDSVDRAAFLQSGDSWSYRLISGADLMAANPLAVTRVEQPVSGDLVLAADKFIRTGTGRIDIAAGRDVQLVAANSVIYTAGVAGPVLADYVVPDLGIGELADFPMLGGDISIYAQSDIKAASSGQLINNWLYRQGRLAADGSLSDSSDEAIAWWPRFRDFEQGVGTLGGGDVKVIAGRDISNLSVSLPTNGRVAGQPGSGPVASGLYVQGGGDFDLRAGGDVNSGIFYLGRGEGRIQAGGDFGSSRTVNVGGGQLKPLNTIIALGEGKVALAAGGNLALETVLNPTLVSQLGESSASPGNVSGFTRRSYYLTYADDSAVTLSSLTGDVTLSNNSNRVALERAFPGLFNSANSLERGALYVYPGTLSATAFSGSVLMNGRFTLAPSPVGNVELLALQSVRFGGTLAMSDVLPSRLPSALSPDAIFSQRIGPLLVNAGAAGFSVHSDPALHSGDVEPAVVVAATGDIVGVADAVDGASIFGVFAKPVRLTAGRDIRNVWLVAQNIDSNDVTRLEAGRDIVFDLLRGLNGAQRSNASKIELGGPGQLEVIAGRNVDLGNSSGIVTRGNLNNPFLIEQGANVLVRAGAVNLQYEAFIGEYIAGSNSYRTDLTEYMRELTGDLSLSENDALAAYLSLPSDRQVEFANLVFYSELKAAGRSASRTAGGIERYADGFDAIAKLFPAVHDGSPVSYAGDVNLFFSQIKTEQGGDIDIMAPGGLVNAGLANPGGLAKKATDLGIVTARGGSIRSFVKGDFLVNQSRVFTLQGGDILIWSSEGNIDAGKGAKTASATPPPLIVIRNDQIILDTTNSVSGSGIGVLLANDDVIPGDVDLIAPRGEVNAGDAGIRAAGNINIAAVRVVGADNISVGGVSTGVPAASTGSIAAGLSGVSNLAADATKSAEQATRALADTAAKASALQQAFRPSFITVEVLGFGDS